MPFAPSVHVCAFALSIYVQCTLSLVHLLAPPVASIRTSYTSFNCSPPGFSVIHNARHLICDIGVNVHTGTHHSSSHMVDSLWYTHNKSSFYVLVCVRVRVNEHIWNRNSSIKPGVAKYALATRDPFHARATETKRFDQIQRGCSMDAFYSRPLIAQKYNLFDGCVIFARLLIHSTFEHQSPQKVHVHTQTQIKHA